MGKDWSYSPFSMNGFHCAKQAGNTIGITAKKEKTAKHFKRTFTMTLKHASKNGIKKNKAKKSQSNPAVSTIHIGRDPHHAAKIIKKQRPITDSQKKVALQKLGKLAASTRSAVRSAAKTQ